MGMSNEYIKSVIARKSSLATSNAVVSACKALLPTLQKWAGRFLLNIEYAGSYAKKTAIGNGSDVDLFISLSPDTPHTLSEVYNNLYNYLNPLGIEARKQNVSIGVKVQGIKIDLVAGKKQSFGNDHSLYKNKKDSWVKTNIKTHINLISQSGRTEEIKAIKIWRDCYGLSFPSFNLEMAVLSALNGKLIGDLSNNVWFVLQYLAKDFAGARFVDPSNQNNVISEDLTILEKQAIKSAALKSLQQKDWTQILW